MTSVTASDAAFLELASSLTPVAVSQYLAVTRPWQLESRQGDVSEIWSLPGDDGDLQGRIMLPFATDYVDFSERFFDALCSIGFINDWDADQVGRRIAAAHADILLIRLDQLDARDTIPLGQADATLDAIHQMLRHAAVTASVPRRANRGGRHPREVSAFLDENVRLGHTKRGSFVFTVVTSLDEPSNGAQAPDGRGGADARFSRKVMMTLARGLEAAYGLVQGEQPEVLEYPGRWGLSLDPPVK